MPPLAPALALLKDLGFINMNHAHVPVSPDSEFDHVVTGAEHSLQTKTISAQAVAYKMFVPTPDLFTRGGASAGATKSNEYFQAPGV